MIIDTQQVADAVAALEEAQAAIAKAADALGVELVASGPKPLQEMTAADHARQMRRGNR